MNRRRFLKSVMAIGVIAPLAPAAALRILREIRLTTGDYVRGKSGYLLMKKENIFIGNPSGGNYIGWDGSNFIVKGDMIVDKDKEYRINADYTT